MRPLDPGPLADLLMKISALQKLETERIGTSTDYRRWLKISIVTARNAPAHERVVNTLKSWGVEVTEAFFLGGVPKHEVLSAFGAHIFFDDQTVHTEPASRVVPSARVPYKNQ